MNYRRHTVILIIIASIVRSIIAVGTELGNDEVYYRLYADVLQWNYFDHPPMVGWLIRLTTFNLFFDNEFTIRLGAILAAAGTTWLLYKCGEKLQNSYAGFLAACIYTASIYGSIIAGTFILPDSPQMFFWMLSIYLLIKITANKTIHTKSIKAVLWFGVVSGIGMLCKIHTAFLWIGFGLYILIYNKEWLTHWALYAAIAISILFFTPVIWWNIQNHFITFFFHGKRVNVAEGGMNIESLLTFVGGQILYNNPVVIGIIGVALRRNKFAIKLAHKRLLLLVSLPLIILATSVSLFKELLPHWTGPAFAGLILLAACYYSQASFTTIKRRLIPLPVTVALWLLVIVIAAGLPLIHLFPGTLGSKNNIKKGDGDFTLDMYGWRKFSTSFDSIYYSTHVKGNEKTPAIIVADKWFPAANINFYVGNHLGVRTLALGPIEDIHQYHWLNEQRGKIPDSTELYIIIPSNYWSDIKEYTVVKNIPPTTVDTVIQNRGGAEARRFYVYYFRKNKFIFNKDLL